MGSSTKILSNILVILLIIGAGYFGYTYFFASPSIEVESPTISSYPEFVSLLNDLRNIDLKEDELSITVLNSLQDFSIDIPERPIGRNNPFSPLGVDDLYIEDATTEEEE